MGFITVLKLLFGALLLNSNLNHGGLVLAYPEVTQASYEAAYSDLKARLSPEATIILPNGPLFENATSRWSEWESPNIKIAVQVATEKDISETIKFANKYNIQFLTKSGGHGNSLWLGKVEHGIEIWLRRLNKVTVNPDGKSATIGGGVLNKEVTDALWAHGKQTVTGVCECIGMISPALGGGHGILQGQHGLVLDNVISHRLVTATGDIITVTKDSYPDLYWGLRGAGQNLGVVASMQQKIYSVPTNDSWAYYTFIFTHDKTAPLFELVNALPLDEERGRGMNLWATAVSIPAVDPDFPVITVSFLSQGPPSTLAKYAAPFIALGPATQDSGATPYPQLPLLTGSSTDAAVCIDGGSTQLFPICLKKYNPQATAELIKRFGELIAQYPAYNRSALLLEAYSVKGVQDVPDESTAFPHRDDDLLIGISITYDANPSLDARATAIGIELRNILQKGSGSNELHAYVNYAQGTEGPKSWYGYEDWRQKKLKALKKKWDPDGRFNFYNPIA